MADPNELTPHEQNLIGELTRLMAVSSKATRYVVQTLRGAEERGVVFHDVPFDGEAVKVTVAKATGLDGAVTVTVEGSNAYDLYVECWDLLKQWLRATFP